MTNDSTTKPIRSMAEWRKAMFPNDPSRHVPDEPDISPAEIATKLAAQAVESLPVRPVKPPQQSAP